MWVGSVTYVMCYHFVSALCCTHMFALALGNAASRLVAPADLLHPPPLPSLDTTAVLQNLGYRSGTVPDILLRRFGSSKSLVQVCSC